MPAGALYVGRPTRWGNPYPVPVHGRAQAVALHQRHLSEHPDLIDTARRELAGRDLACWCPLDEPCHADTLLNIANQRPPVSGRT